MMLRTLSTRSASAIRAVAAVATAVALLWTTTVLAQADPGVQWTQTGLATPAFELMTPTSGALFARTRDGLMRSNDAGDTWASVTLPAWQPDTPQGGYPGQIVVDPTNH